MRKTKFFIIPIVCLLVSILIVSGIFQSIAVVEASNVKMPGIETIINDTSKKEPFQILEIVKQQDEEEIGYYIEGQEPFIRNYSYGNQTFSSLEEGLKFIEKESDRKEFAEASAFQDKIKNQIGDNSEKFPLSYKEYKEKYFLGNLDQKEDWTKVEFDKNHRVLLKGSYEKNTTSTGNYTKGEQSYYPIRENVPEDKQKTGLYRENIATFSYVAGMGAVSPYLLEFEAVTNDEINQKITSDKAALANEYKNGYGYYINVYHVLTSDTDPTMFPGEGSDFPIYRGVEINEYPYHYYIPASNGLTWSHLQNQVTQKATKEGDITLENHTYYYWSKDSSGKLKKETLYYIEGKETITYDEIHALSSNLPQDYTYYYKVKEVKFASRLTQNGDSKNPTSYEYYGWYNANYKDSKNPYILVTTGDGTTATHYISEEEYFLTKGTGEYDFILDNTKTEKEVEVDSLYYQGGIKNNNWLKKYVFHLEEGETSFDNFQIQVTAKTSTQIDQMSSQEREQLLKQYDLVYIHSGLKQESVKDIANMVTKKEFAALIRCDSMTASEKNMIKNQFSYYWLDSDADGNYVKENVYFISIKGNQTGYGIFNSFLNQVIVDATNQTELQKSGFQEVIHYIQEENIYRNIEGLEEIEEIVSRAKVIEYILNFQYKRITVDKTELNILDLEPAISSGQVTQTKVKQWLGLPSTSTNPKINITVMTTSEFIGKIDDLNTKYDLIYIGSDYQTSNAKASTVWGITMPSKGVAYAHVGGKFTQTGLDAKKYAGMLDIEYQDGANRSALKSSLSLPLEMSGNDLTKQQVKALQDFVDSGYPVIISDGLMENNQVNPNVVDNSSYMYEVLVDILSEDNVMVSNQIDITELAFYANLDKPKIVFTQNGCPPSAIGTSSGPSGNYLQGNQLEYEFYIEHNVVATAESATYNCELFVDLNADGVFSDGVNSAENLTDIQIYDEAGKQVLRGEDGKYHLKVNKIYHVIRGIPEKYYKLIQWKLQVTSNLKNGEHIRGSVIGYTKKQLPKGETKPKIRALQIKSNNKSNWTLANDKNDNKTGFMDLASTIEDFTLTMETVTVNQYRDYYTNTNAKIYGMDWLSQYDMVIVGFADMVDDIPTGNRIKDYDGVYRNAVEGLVKYIENGNSVLFSHDTTSFTNHQFRGQYTNGLKDNELAWGYNLNTIMRPLVGMDRYGITSSKQIGESTETVGSILKKGLALSGATLEKVKSQADDVAYEFGSNRTRTSASVHGYNTDIINRRGNTNRATQVNEGPITEYPFKIDKNLVVSTTHGQYYQLALEADDDGDGMNDIVVWYCLANGNYVNFPNDVRNSYYLYSKGNVMYTGVGHSSVNQVMEKKLFINTIVAAWRAGKSEPDVKFVEEFQANASEQTTKYYATDENQGVGSKQDNIINKSLELYLTIDDIKLIPGTSENTTSDLGMEFYVSDSQGTVVGGLGLSNGEKVSKLEVESVSKKTNTGTVLCEKKADGSWKVESGNVYKVIINDISNYVTKNGSYTTPFIYAKVNSNYTYYGKQEVSSGYAKVKLWRRQIFDLD